MYEETRISKLSELLNSALRRSSGNKADKQEAYSNTIRLLEGSMMSNLRKEILRRDSNETEREERGKRKSESQTAIENYRNVWKERNDNREGFHKKVAEQEKDQRKRKNSVEASKPRKKRMKWNDYLQLQVDKQRKINEELGIKLKKKIKEKKTADENSKGVCLKKNINSKELDKNLRKYKPVQINDNFKKLDEQECFFEEDEAVIPNNKPQELVQKPTDLPEILEDPNKNEEFDNSEKALDSLLKHQLEEDSKIKEILQRYEKTIGKIKHKNPIEQSCKSPSKPQTALLDRRSKSAYSHHPTESQQNAYNKLKQLQDEETKIKQQKEELLKFLESRSQVKGATRPATVASLYNKREPLDLLRTPHHPPTEKPCLPEILPLQRHPLRSSDSKHTRRNSTTEIHDLITSLF